MFDEIMYFYHDPLFGASILLGIVAIIIFADWGKNKYQAKKREMALEDFAKSYSEGSLSDEIIDFLSISKNPTPPLILLAKTYSLAGDRGYAIKIYLGLLEKARNTEEKIIILESLGVTYFEAGFLQRAKEIFLEIIKSYPRNKQVLDYLMRVYESMGEYEEALDALESIEELSLKKERAQNEQMRIFLHFMLLKNSNFLSLEKKRKEIIALMRYCAQINRLGLEYLSMYDREAFWQEVIRINQHSKNAKNNADALKSNMDYNADFNKDLEVLDSSKHLTTNATQNPQNKAQNLANNQNEILEVLDILWRFKKEEIPFEKLKNHKNILDIFRAKGYVKDEIQCDVFELEALRILLAHSLQKGELTFEYRCNHCKNIFPFDSYRCPLCANIGQMDLVFKIIESTTKDSNMDFAKNSAFINSAKQFASNFSTT
ncbi:tetratricopeptide repeat protein [Helicobacter sp. T3_23-1059]